MDSIIKQFINSVMEMPKVCRVERTCWIRRSEDEDLHFCGISAALKLAAITIVLMGNNCFNSPFVYFSAYVLYHILI
mgnify:CR=1 FL=1